MASQPDHIKQYTAPDFERYYAGQMTAREMHALEKAALEDPFLADALEGYKHSLTPIADMEALKEKVTATMQAGKSREGKRKKRLMPVFRIAALLLLLAGAGWTIHYFTGTEDASVAIQREAEQTVPEHTVAAPALTDSAPRAETLQQESQKAKAEAGAPVRQMKAAERTITKPPIAIEQAEEKEDIALSRATPAPVQPSVQTFAADSIMQATPGMEVQAMAAQNTFKGRVVDERNNPVPNASVMTNNSRERTVTDINGNFSLKTPDSTLTATVNAVGYEAGLLHLNKGADSQRVVLRGAQHALSEVVVIGYGRQRQKAAARANAEVGQLEPTEGWTSFNDYIARNLKSPDDQGFRPSPGGEVRLSFDVNDKGEPVNIKVEKSLCEECDREAIRLLKEGPKWKKKKGKKGEVVIRF